MSGFPAWKASLSIKTCQDIGLANFEGSFPTEIHREPTRLRREKVTLVVLQIWAFYPGLRILPSNYVYIENI